MADAHLGFNWDRVTTASRKPPLFDKNWLEEFATGDIVKCLGPEYSHLQKPPVPAHPQRGSAA